MNDWVVETPAFEEILMNNRVIMLNQNGVNRVVEIIKQKDKEIEKLKNIIEDLKAILKSKGYGVMICNDIDSKESDKECQ